ncbi:hypothetical protein [Crassaminicella indica]|uniref:Uncharacterized protein n=1 Tax=Crassaminicella indica TaxID=2855394 RepID=A0ABX8RDT5_9CLOT|nr:hypothetical protein [Crassaminicella indica]QXM06065.1 hypothetical protein KVH43_12035 [Crassaminicella indica]
MSKILKVIIYEPTQENINEYNERAAKALAKILFKNMSYKNMNMLINTLEKYNKDKVVKEK